jgi:hypothetical protein
MSRRRRFSVARRNVFVFAAALLYLAAELLLGRHMNTPVGLAQSGLVAAYSFDEGSGSMVTDASGNGNHGTISGAVWTNTAKFGRALVFDGNDDTVTVSDHPSLDLTTGLTLEAWVRPVSGNKWEPALVKEGISVPAYSLYSANEVTDRPYARLRIGSVSQGVFGGSRLARLSWSHLATTYDGATIRLYVNAALVGGRPAPGSIQISGSPLHIGASTLLREFFRGEIDEVRVYNRALTAAEIAVDRTTPIGLTPPEQDVTPPVVSLTAPADNSIVTGIVEITGTASDDEAVEAVQFFVDGALLGAADTAAPYSVSWNTVSAGNGPHTITANARDEAGNVSVPAAITVTVNNIPPRLTITQPAAGASIDGSVVDVAYGTSGDLIGVDHVHLSLDGAPIVDAALGGAFRYTNVTEGAHTVSGVLARADHTAIAGSDAAPVSFTTVIPDETAPAVQLSAPSANSVVSGDVIVSAIATDDEGVAGVQFFVDGAPLGAEDTTAPYSVTWTTKSAINGSHSLTARARDGAGNTAMSAATAVSVNNVAPRLTISEPASGATIDGDALNISYGIAGDPAGVDHVHFILDEGGSVMEAGLGGAFQYADVSEGSHTLYGHLARADHTRIEGSDAAAVSFSIAAVDETAPSVEVSAPAADAVVSGDVTVSAAASDEDAVAGVQFLIDGTELGAEDTTEPYSVAWNTRDAGNGAHLVTARARDVSGNTAVSAAVAVVVNNVVPRLTIQAPAAGSTIDGNTVNVAYSTTGDLTGVDHVHFVLDGGTEVMDRTLDGVFQYGNVAPGAHTLNGFLVRADHTKIAGTDADPVSFTTVLPDTTSPTVQISAPAPNSTVGGEVTVSAVAADDKAIAGVQFLLDGSALGAEDVAAPYSVQWNTTLAAGGAHTLTARARDTSGNSATSLPVPVTVGNTTGSAAVGEWAAPFETPLVAVHLVLMPNGKVMMWDAGDFTGEPATVWDPHTGAMSPAPQNFTDLFCSGHVMLADGTLLTLGGDTRNTGLGVRDVNLFNPFTGGWKSMPPMSFKRWYPTGVTLSDGRVLVHSGYGECYDASCRIATPEIFNPATSVWTSLPSANYLIPTYPFLFDIGGNRVLSAGSYEGTVDTRVLDLTTNTWSIVDPQRIDAGSAVMYAPGKIMKAGKWANSDPPFVPAHANTYVLDMTQPAPAWRQTAPMNYPRAYNVLTLLPDGTTLATGGSLSTDPGNMSQAVLDAEIWSPDTETWTVMARMKNPRLYHGSAILLPDGRVLVAGSGRYGSAEQFNGEVFSPPYLFKGPRPVIAAAPALVKPGSQFFLGSGDNDIASVTMLRTGAMTHSFNSDQRFLKLSYAETQGGFLVDAPTAADGLPPGYYLVFLVNSRGVPSVGAFVRVPAPSEDLEPPTAPSGLAAAGALASASLSWSAATDNTAVAGYEVHRSSVEGFVPDSSTRIGQSATTSFLATGLSTGVHYFRVIAYDATGNLSGPSGEAKATVTGDIEPPTVAMTSPLSAAQVSGSVTVAANAADNVAVAGVQFLLDGAPLGAEDTTAPYTIVWNSATGTAGIHQLSAIARDPSGNKATALPLTVTVSTTQPPGLVLALGFNEGAGSQVADESGNNNHGTFINGTWGSGKYGAAPVFDGVESWVTVADAASLDLSSQMTISAWVNPSSTAADWSTIVLKERAPGLAYALYATDGGARPPAGYVNVGGSDMSVVSPAVLPLNTWTHVATTYGGGAMRIYVNGVLRATRSLTGTMPASTGSLRIGGNSVWGEYFAGAIDEVRVYNRALTEAEIQTDMTTPIE